MLAVEKRRRLDDCRAILGRLSAAIGDSSAVPSKLELECDFATFISHMTQQQQPVETKEAAREGEEKEEEEEEEAFHLFATGSFASCIASHGILQR